MTTQVLKIAFLCLSLSFPAIACAQEDEGIFLQNGVVQRRTQVRVRPSGNQPVIKELQPNASVRIVSPQPRRGFLRVILEKGRQGYIPMGDVRVTPIAGGVANIFAARANPPCAQNLGNCQANGCAPPGTPHAILNEAKRHVPSGNSPVLLSFADFQRLQEQTDDKVDQGSELSQQQRNSLRNFSVTNGTVGEGSFARVAGFIAQGLDPHPNTGESVNCRFTQSQSNDFHISLAPRATNTEFKGIVVEMIPQDRPAGWTISKLRTIKQQRRLVMAIGGLFYDNLHVVNADPNDPLSGQPKRFSLWEVHPITRFFVCTRPNNACNPNVVSQWTKLEDFQ